MSPKLYQQFRNLLTYKNKSLKFIEMKEDVILIKHGNYEVGYLDYRITEVAFVKPDADIFHKHNAVGVLAELIMDSEIPFETMFFGVNNKKYKTNRAMFVKYGIIEEFDFGDKLFLPIPKLKDCDDPQIELNLGGSNV